MSSGDIVADGDEPEVVRRSLGKLTPSERIATKRKVDDLFDQQIRLDRDRLAHDTQIGRHPVTPQSPTSMAQSLDFNAAWAILLDSLESGLFGKPITLQDLMSAHETMLRKRADQVVKSAKHDADYKAEVERQRTDANRLLAKRYQPFIHCTRGFEVTGDLILQATDAQSCQYCGSKFPIDLVPRFDILLAASERGSGVWIEEQRRHHCPGNPNAKPPIPGRMFLKQPWGCWIDLPGAAGMRQSNVPPRVFVDEKPLL